ncbi:MAG TPA: proton-conducting transporter membrane subunit [Propionibacteriaceae bacterium]|nr:proton-conducting transporter membrane subunit [Propionibacteriaceae bacterium]
MTAVGGLGAAGALAFLAVLLAVVVPARYRSVAAGSACFGVGIAGVLTGVAAVTTVPDLVLVIPVAFPDGLGIDPLVLSPSPLGGVFCIVVGAVGAVSALYGIGYAHGPAASRTGWSAFAVFLLGMLLVASAADAISFLLGWETMAVASTVLLLADHAARPAVRSAGVWYAVMTHLSFLSLLTGFALLATTAHGTAFARITAAHVTGPVGVAAFLLLLVGFATKAGLVPLHVWLPRAHPEAPSHVSAVMSAAMVKLGVYGIILVTTAWLPDISRPFGLLVLALGALSGLYGILQASVTSDLKRLLAYSTTENVGLAVTAVGIGMLLSSAGQGPVANVALVAALLLVVSHAAFKTVLFLGAGTILAATGERDLDRLGGLARSHPVTAWAFGIGAMGAAALPVTSGFAAEWTLLQALVHGDGRASTTLALALPVALGLVALTIGLGLLTFVKAFGMAFLARPRSAAAASPRPEAAGAGGAAMTVALGVGAVAVLALGLAVGPVAATFSSVLGYSGAVLVELGGLRLVTIGALDPSALVLVALALSVPVALLVLLLRRRTPRRTTDVAWGCGGARTSPRMEYTATSYAEPLVRVFGEALRPTRSLEVSHLAEDHVLENRVAFAQDVTDVVEDRGYAPFVTWLHVLGDQARRVQNGSIHRYLGFSFAALVVVLALVTLT